MEFLKLNPFFFLFFFIDRYTRLIFRFLCIYFQGMRMKFFREKVLIFSKILRILEDGRSSIYNVSYARGEFFSF